MQELKDRVALITGAAGNLGQATGEAFREAGARTVLVDHAVGRLEELYPERIDAAEHMLVGGVDLTDAAAVEDLTASVMDRFGRIDILVNTVGTYRGGKPVHEERLETWELLFDANVRTTLLALKAVVPVMLKQGSGRIVNVASRNALHGTAKVAAYSASKSAVVRLTESLAAELEASGIGVNCVLPSTIDTPQNREAMPNADFSDWVKPEAIATVILFLAGDAARGITGAAVPVYRGE
jgi:NAD(P)-dependent dehydrogenase (short-subunit alcohol dehydrogenase family)